MADSPENIGAALRGKFGELPGPGDVRQRPVHQHCETHGDWMRQETMDGPVLSPDCPQCIEERRMSNDLGRAAIPPRYQDHSLETYDASGEGQKKALNACRQYVGDIPETVRRGQNLVFLGTVGTGKTHLACAIGREFIRSGRTVMYARTSEIIRLIRETWRGDTQDTEQKRYDRLQAYDLLIIDELGQQAGTDNERQILLSVIDNRYDQGNKPTILISNLSAPQLKELLGVPGYDRIRENARVVNFEWESYRGKGEKNEP